MENTINSDSKHKIHSSEELEYTFNALSSVSCINVNYVSYKDQDNILEKIEEIIAGSSEKQITFATFLLKSLTKNEEDNYWVGFIFKPNSGEAFYIDPLGKKTPQNIRDSIENNVENDVDTNFLEVSIFPPLQIGNDNSIHSGVSLLCATLDLMLGNNQVKTFSRNRSEALINLFSHFLADSKIVQQKDIKAERQFFSKFYKEFNNSKSLIDNDPKEIVDSSKSFFLPTKVTSEGVLLGVRLFVPNKFPYHSSLTHNLTSLKGKKLVVGDFTDEWPCAKYVDGEIIKIKYKENDSNQNRWALAKFKNQGDLQGYFCCEDVSEKDAHHPSLYAEKDKKIPDTVLLEGLLSDYEAYNENRGSEGTEAIYDIDNSSQSLPNKSSSNSSTKTNKVVKSDKVVYNTFYKKDEKIIPNLTIKSASFGKSLSDGNYNKEKWQKY